MDFSSLVSPRVAEERKRLGLSQESAGQACGVSREMWGKYERGKAVMGTEVLALFAAAGADVLYILTGQRSGAAAPTPALKPEEATLLDNYRHASPEGKKAIKATSDALAQPSSGNGGKKSA